MKKAFLILFFAFFVATADAHFFVGPQAGFSVATLKKTTYTVSSKFGYHGGLMANFSLSDHVGIMGGILYSTKGFKYDFTTGTTSSQVDTNGNNATVDVNFTANVDAVLGYLDFPLMLTLYSGETKGLFIQAGPQFSYLISSNSNLATATTLNVNTGSNSPVTPITDATLDFHKADIAFIGGIGYKFPSFLLVYARAATALLKVQDGTLVKDENYGRNFAIEVGVAMTLGGK